MIRSVALATVGLLWVSSCARPVESPKVAQPSRVETIAGEAETYLPLPNNTVYSYTTTREDTGESGVLVMQVERPRPGRVDINVAGRRQRLEIEAQGIRHLAGGYLLKSPLAQGHSFRGNTGTVTISDTNKSIQVEAGSFTGCLETVEEGTLERASKRVTTVYCPAVGIVSLAVEATSDAGYTSEHAALRWFGPKVDLEISSPSQ